VLDPALELGVEDLVPLLGDGQRARVTSALGLDLGLGRRRRLSGRRRSGRRSVWRLARGHPELIGELGKLGLLCGEFQLELLGVDALRRGDEDALAEELQLELQLPVRREEPLVVGRELVGALLLGVRTYPLGRERRLGRGEARP
jgi:hypothetical protein